MVERGLIETLGKYAKVPYWRCLPSEEKQKFVKFRDVLVENSGIYDFSSSDEEKKDADDFEPVESKKRVDIRDHTLIMSIKSDFEFAEYINRHTREYKERPSKNFIFGGEGPKAIKSGRKMMVNNFVQHYKKYLPELFSNPNENPLLAIRRYFVNNGVLEEGSSINGESELFLAMWLNAPVRKGARWVLK